MARPEFDFETYKNNKLFLIYFLIIIFPFNLLYWMVPFVTDITISKDYPLHPITEQLELFFSMKTGSFPLYAPGYNLGHSSSALTLGQIYHPISNIASLLPGYWSGMALEWNTFLRILSLGITQLALFTFLRKLRLNIVFSFVISLATVYNLRMLEALRYGASLEAFTGHLMLCAIIGHYCISPSKWLGPLSIIGVTYMLVCSGHPPMMFYGFIGVVLLLAVLPFYLSQMIPDKSFNFMSALSFWKRVGLFMLLGVLLASIYLIPLKYEFVNANTKYTSSGFQPDMGQDTLVGALNNFFIPFASSLLDSFGGSLLMLIALLLPLLRIFGVKVPYVIWFLWGCLIYTILYILGPDTPVFRFAWDYFPLIPSLGQVGRIAIIIPTIIMMLMAWIVNAEAVSVRFKGVSTAIAPYRLLGAMALIIAPVYLVFLFLLKPKLGHFTPHAIRAIPFWIELASVIFGLLSLVLLVFYNKHSKAFRILGTALCIMVIVQTGIIMKYGMWTEHKRDMPTFEQLKERKRKTLDYSFQSCPNTQHRVVLDHLSHSFMEPFLGRIFTQATPVESQEEAYVQMQDRWLPQQIFIEGLDPEKANEITEDAKHMDKGMVKLVYSSFNRLQFRLNSEAPAFFGLSYPYTGHWRAWVNGERVRVYRGNGILNAAEIPKGESIIEFRYWSDAFFWGVLITCLVFVMIGVYISSRALSGYLRVVCIVLIIVSGAGGFLLWYNSLYTGDNLNTKYQWDYTPPKSPLNIAYGKKTFGYSLPSLSYLHWHSSNAVDGDTSPGSGLPLGVTDDKVLIVDLNIKEEIKSIVLYGEIVTRPEIYISQNGIEWEMIDSVFNGSAKSPLRIVFKELQVVRYIKVKSSKPKLYLDELEVYRAF